jgi:hypothetical protein
MIYINYNKLDKSFGWHMGGNNKKRQQEEKILVPDTPDKDKGKRYQKSVSNDQENHVIPNSEDEDEIEDYPLEIKTKKSLRQLDLFNRVQSQTLLQTIGQGSYLKALGDFVCLHDEGNEFADKELIAFSGKVSVREQQLIDKYRAESLQQQKRFIQAPFLSSLDNEQQRMWDVKFFHPGLGEVFHHNESFLYEAKKKYDLAALELLHATWLAIKQGHTPAYIQSFIEDCQLADPTIREHLYVFAENVYKKCIANLDTNKSSDLIYDLYYHRIQLLSVQTITPKLLTQAGDLYLAAAEIASDRQRKQASLMRAISVYQQAGGVRGEKVDAIVKQFRQVSKLCLDAGSKTFAVEKQCLSFLLQTPVTQRTSADWDHIYDTTLHLIRAYHLKPHDAFTEFRSELTAIYQDMKGDTVSDKGVHHRRMLLFISLLSICYKTNQEKLEQYLQEVLTCTQSLDPTQNYYLERVAAASKLQGAIIEKITQTLMKAYMKPLDVEQNKQSPALLISSDYSHVALTSPSLKSNVELTSPAVSVDSVESVTITMTPPASQGVTISMTSSN